MQGSKLPTVQEKFDRHRRAGHRYQCSKKECCGPSATNGSADKGAKAYSQGYLEQATQYPDLINPPKEVQMHLSSHSKEEKGYANLGETPNKFHIARKSGSVWTDHDSR